MEKASQKANRTLGFLRRNIKTNTVIKTKAYQALVRPHLEYACQVWDPHKQSDIQMLENVQRRAARFVAARYHNTSSVSEMLDMLQWETLEQRRAKLRLLFLYKISKNIVDLNAENYLLPSTSRYSTHYLNYRRPNTTTNYHKYSFFPRTIGQWNNLSPEIKQSSSLELFKTKLSNCFIPKLARLSLAPVFSMHCTMFWILFWHNFITTHAGE